MVLSWASIGLVASCGPMDVDDDLSDPRFGCLQKHLKDAVELNERRRPMYAELTEGASTAVSDKLIADERLGLLVASSVDDSARPFQRSGIPIVCDEFVSMDSVGEFRRHVQPPPEGLAGFSKQDGKALHDKLSRAFERDGFEGIASEVSVELDRMEAHPEYHCMVRHVLASMLRVANFAPVHDAKARDKGVGSTLAVSEQLVRLHLLSVENAVVIDEQAAPIQAQGIPIVCQDVPDIPPR